MQRAVEGLRLVPQPVLVDGNRMPALAMPVRGHRQGRCQGGGDLGRVHPGQGAARPPVPRTARALPRLRLRRPQGLPDAGAPGRAAAAWAPAPAHRRSFAPVRAGRWPARGARRLSEPLRITSRDNPLAAAPAPAGADGAAYRRLGQVWLEGDHLCGALRARGGAAAQAVLSEEAWHAPGAARTGRLGRAQSSSCPAPLFAGISALESPARIGFVIDLPPPAQSLPAAASRGAGPGAGPRQRRQHPAQRGGVRRRAGAGAQGHGGAVVAQGAARRHGRALRAAPGRRAWTRTRWPRCGCRWWPPARTPASALPAADLPRPCAWVLGHEGQGVSATLLARCALQVRIPQPGGEESLNVAAAAAVCLYESARRRFQ